MNYIRADARMALARYESSVAAFGMEAGFPMKDVRAVQAYIEELESALTPFLKLPIGVINDDPPEMEVYQCHGWPRDQLAVVTVADFRRVRKALGER